MKWFPRRPLISDNLWNAALQRHPIVTRYTAEQRLALRTLAERFLGTMQIRWVAGLQPRQSAQVSLAMLACLPILNLDLRWYRRWRTVLIVAHDYRTESMEIDEAGVVHEGVSDAAGEYSQWGTVVLSLDDLQASGTGNGFNVVIHECAHVLDSANGTLDGAPPLHVGMDVSRWSAALSDAYTDLQRRVIRKKRRGRSSSFDPQAAESPEEFFAAASELFFERPQSLLREYPDVHQQLALFYRQERR